MNDPVPPPPFDRSKYERPNDAWVCGRLCDGQPCHLGPTPGGVCRSTDECRPLLETRPGEIKGRWKCTRSKEAGGPCELGPGPTGVCGRPIIPCVPQRSLRQLRGRLTAAVIALTVGGLLLLCGGPWRWRFVSPGRVSSPHRGLGFQALASRHFGATSAPGSAECAGCHEAAQGGLTRWVRAAANADPGPFEWGRLARATPDQHTRMDERNCLACHAAYDRHQPDVVKAHSCSDCHREHRGERIAAPSDDSCAQCHGATERLAHFAGLATDTDPLAYHPPVAAGLVAFLTPRPGAGRTQAFAHYWDGHPDFGLHRAGAGVTDPNTLRFNHQLHLGATVKLRDAPAGESRGLACADCHQPDATGAYLARIRFGQHCQSCHSLQFDPVNPEVKLPHAAPAAVRATVASLATLQTRYADLARTRGETDRAKIDDFARTGAARVRQLLGSGEELVDLILFTGDPRRRMFADDGGDAGKRAHYAGCAYCHEVGRDALGQPVVTPPRIPDRWLLGGRFHHAKHAKVGCLECHGTVLQSARTADINLPHQTSAGAGPGPNAGGQKSCVDCHRPGGAPANCATCHTYHLLKPL